MTLREYYNINKINPYDKQHIARGVCPWCHEKTVDGSLIGLGKSDYCKVCDNVFHSDDEAMLKIIAETN